MAYLKDTVLLSSQSTFSWHPTKKEFLYTSSDRGDGFAEGTSEFPNDSTFVTTVRVYRSNGDSYDHRDESFIVNDSVHRNKSYGKDETGEWIEKGDWTWTRDLVQKD